MIISQPAQQAPQYTFFSSPLAAGVLLDLRASTTTYRVMDIIVTNDATSNWQRGLTDGATLTPALTSAVANFANEFLVYSTQALGEYYKNTGAAGIATVLGNVLIFSAHI